MATFQSSWDAAPPRSRILAEVDLTSIVAGDLSEGTLDLKSLGDGPAGTITLNGVACDLNVGGSAGAVGLSFIAGVGLRNTKTANNNTAPFVDIKIGNFFDAQAYARVFVQLLTAWENFDPDTSATHSVNNNIMDRTPGTLVGGCRITHIQNNGVPRATRASGNGLLAQDVNLSLGSRFGAYVRTFDIRGRTVDFAEEAGSAFYTPSSYPLRGSDNAEAPEAPGTHIFDNCQAWWLTHATTGETGANDNAQYNFDLAGFRIIVQDLAEVP